MMNESVTVGGRDKIVTTSTGYHGYVIGWGTLALINANLAQAKKRSGLAWFLISLLLGPIATFILAILGRPRL